MSRRWVQRTPFGASVARRLEDEERKTHGTGRPKKAGGLVLGHIFVRRTSQQNFSPSGLVEFNTVVKNEGSAFSHPSADRIKVEQAGLAVVHAAVNFSTSPTGDANFYCELAGWDTSVPMTVTHRPGHGGQAGGAGSLQQIVEPDEEFMLSVWSDQASTVTSGFGSSGYWPPFLAATLFTI